MDSAFANIKASDFKKGSKAIAMAIAKESSQKGTSIAIDLCEWNIERIADSLVEKFNAPDSKRFFCLCARKLSEHTIWQIYETSQRGYVKEPFYYFIGACNREIHKQKR